MQLILTAVLILIVVAWGIVSPASLTVVFDAALAAIYQKLRLALIVGRAGAGVVCVVPRVQPLRQSEAGWRRR